MKAGQAATLISVFFSLKILAWVLPHVFKDACELIYYVGCFFGLVIIIYLYFILRIINKMYY
jgi:cytosine/uracil/thiamine/allantoin permease